jgi:hypothetical protein
MTLELTDLPILRKSAFTLKYYFEDGRPGRKLCVQIGLERRKLPAKNGRSSVGRDFEPVFPAIVCGAENRLTKFPFIRSLPRSENKKQTLETTRLRILLVEDNEDLAGTLLRLLQNPGDEVVRAKGSLAILKLVRDSLTTSTL